MQQYFTEQADNYDEAYRKVREKYGDNVQILFRKTVILPGRFLGLFPREGVEVSGPIPQLRKTPYEARNPMDPGFTRDMISKEQWVQKEPAQKNPVVNAEPLDFDREKAKVLAAAGSKDPTLQMVLSEVRTIKEKIDEQNLGLNQEEHPSIKRMDEILCLNDFPPSYRTSILTRLKKEFSLDALEIFKDVQDKVLEWIGESISIYEDSPFHRKPRIIVLVGPTGVGKTTTIAKLAANFGIDSHGKRIREIVLVTIDIFRIGARQQLEAYGEILKSPCFAVHDFNELKKIIALHSEGTDIILIDTIGKSPRDSMKLGEMKQLLDACGSLAETHLAVSAATKSSDIHEILQQFEPFNYKSVIITKIDETTRVGNIIGALAEKNKSVSYITNGQKVPADICRAQVSNFLMNLEGFKVNRIKLDGLFPETESGQFRQWS